MKFDKQMVALGVVVTGVLILILVSLPHYRVANKRLQSAKNLRAIGEALDQYTRQFGVPPPAEGRQDYLIANNCIEKGTLHIPAADSREGLYHLVAFESRLPESDSVIIFEDPCVHKGAGAHVLYANGAVEYLESDRLRRVLKDSWSGRQEDLRGILERLR